jgi:hypothetical protein
LRTLTLLLPAPKAGTAADAKKADVVLRVRRPSETEIKSLKSGAIVLAQMDPYGNMKDDVEAMAKAGVTGVRHGVDAAHHPRAGDGRSVLSGKPCRLSGGYRCRGRL